MPNTAEYYAEHYWTPDTMDAEYYVEYSWMTVASPNTPGWQVLRRTLLDAGHSLMPSTYCRVLVAWSNPQETLAPQSVLRGRT